jgi:hypothetical protein
VTPNSRLLHVCRRHRADLVDKGFLFVRSFRGGHAAGSIVDLVRFTGIVRRSEPANIAAVYGQIPIADGITDVSFDNRDRSSADLTDDSDVVSVSGVVGGREVGAILPVIEDIVTRGRDEGVVLGPAS